MLACLQFCQSKAKAKQPGDTWCSMKTQWPLQFSERWMAAVRRLASNMLKLWILCFYADIYNLSSWYGNGSRNKSKTAVGIARDIAEIHGVISFLFTIPPTPIQWIEILPLCQHSIRQLQVIRGSLNVHLLRSRFHQLRLYNQKPQQNRRRSPCRRRREVFSSLVRFLVVVCSKKIKKASIRVHDVHAVFNIYLYIIIIFIIIIIIVIY